MVLKKDCPDCDGMIPRPTITVTKHKDCHTLDVNGRMVVVDFTEVLADEYKLRLLDALGMAEPCNDNDEFNGIQSVRRTHTIGTEDTVIYIRRDRPDSSTPLFDIPTPAEIAAAHPKCGTCGHLIKCGEDGGPIWICGNMANPDMYRRGVGIQRTYCPNHSSITETYP